MLVLQVFWNGHAFQCVMELLGQFSVRMTVGYERLVFHLPGPFALCVNGSILAVLAIYGQSAYGFSLGATQVALGEQGKPAGTILMCAPPLRHGRIAVDECTLLAVAFGS